MPDKTEELLAERGQDYGDPVDTHIRIAEVWSGILGHPVQPVEVALMMVGLKLVRAAKGPTKQDSYDDAHAYVSIAETIIKGEQHEASTDSHG